MAEHAVLDPFVGLAQHGGHVRHVKVADVRAEDRVEFRPERVHLAVERPGVDRVIRLATKIEIRHEQVPNVLGALNLTPGKVVELLGFVGQQPLADGRAQLADLVHHPGGAVAPDQVNEEFMVQVGRIDRFQRSGVALAPVADQIAVQAARPANPALQKRETQPGKAPGYAVHEDGLAHGLAGGGKVADVVIHKVGDRGPQPDTRRGRMKAGRDTEFYTLGPHRVVVVLAIQPQGIVPLGVAAGLGRVFGYRRHRSALEAGQHGRLGAAVRGHKLQLFNRLLGRVHGNHRRRGQAVLQALELLGRIHIERAAGRPAHLLVA